mgnify:CR=1 FL=1
MCDCVRSMTWCQWWRENFNSWSPILFHKRNCQNYSQQKWHYLWSWDYCSGNTLWPRIFGKLRINNSSYLQTMQRVTKGSVYLNSDEIEAILAAAAALFWFVQQNYDHETEDHLSNPDHLHCWFILMVNYTGIAMGCAVGKWSNCRLNTFYTESIHWFQTLKFFYLKLLIPRSSLLSHCSYILSFQKSKVAKIKVANLLVTGESSKLSAS